MIKNILITSAGNMFSKKFSRNFKKFNPKGKVFTTDMNPTIKGILSSLWVIFKVP